WYERQVGDGGHQTVERQTVFATLHDPMIRTGRNQQCHNTDHRKDRNCVQIVQSGGEFLIEIAENRSELETEQDLCAEDQYPRLVESKLDFLVSSMSLVRGRLREDTSRLLRHTSLNPGSYRPRTHFKHLTFHVGPGP